MASGNLTCSSLSNGSRNDTDENSYEVNYLSNLDNPATPDPGSYLVAGINIIAVEVHNNTLDSSDGFFDGRLIGSPPAGPSPGIRNADWAANAPPAIRQVNNAPQMPAALTPVTITAKITDPDGVGNVSLQYQLVDPGSYIALTDAAYSTNWTTVSMHDDGLNGDAAGNDGVYSVIMPAALQTNRRIVRYRISATDGKALSVTVPYTDDASPNFAYYVYNGVPAWTGAVQPGVTQPVTYGTDVMNSVQPFQLITKQTDAENSTWYQQYSYTDNTHFWYGTVVYNGQVYDHITYRPRGGVWRYAMGKNMWKFSFNRNHEIQMLDDYGNPMPTKSRDVNFGACIQQGDYLNRGEQGLYESVGFKLFNLAGVAAPHNAFMQFRVVDKTSETGTTQYNGDLWGLYLYNEEPDGNFLDSHDLADGNLYKMDTEGTGPGGGSLQNQGPTQVTDNSDLASFTQYGSTDQWYIDNLDLDEYYSYRAIVEAIHHGDIGSGKNYYYYHDPVTNKWSVFPWDLDLTWADNMYGNGAEPLRDRVLPITEFSLDYKNRLREIRDLLYNTEQTGQIIDEMAAKIYTPGQPSFVNVDRAMWDYNPIMVSSYVNSSKAGQGRFYQYAVTPPGGFPGMIQKMKNYIVWRSTTATSGWTAMDALDADTAIPNTPTVAYVGPAGYALDGLTFRSSAFSSPVGSSFAAMEWRIAEITDPTAPGYDPKAPKHYEIQSNWESGEITTYGANITIPPTAVQAGHIYRVRVRMKDSTGRWSHWSSVTIGAAGTQFTAAQGSQVIRQGLRVTELNYHPADPGGLPYSRDDFEFIELKNISSQVLNLQGATFDKGIDYTFGNVSLSPGECLVLAKNPTAFAMRYSTYGIRLYGPYSGKFDDGGERVRLLDGLGQTVLDFTYSDAWYPSTDGDGYTLAAVNPSNPGDLTQSASWTASRGIDGTPGADECTIPDGAIVVNEVLTHTDSPDGDQIELYNTSDQSVDVSNWWLSDDSLTMNLQKYQIQPGTPIAAHQYRVFKATSQFDQSGAPAREFCSPSTSWAMRSPFPRPMPPCAQRLSLHAAV